MPEVTVVLATYNENPKFLKICIDSILNQTYKDFELVICVEPGDQNIDLLENKITVLDDRIKILKNSSRLGIAGSRNKAIMESSGKYIAIIDGDDYCDLSRFEKQLNFFENNNPDISVVGSNMYLIDENNNIIGERIYPEFYTKIKKKFLITNAIANPTVMVKKSVFEKFGLFDAKLTKCEDFELWMRFLSNNVKMQNLQKHLVYYRVLMTHNKKRSVVNWRNNYIARKKYSKFIWHYYQRFPSLFFFFIISCIPNILSENLLNIGIINKIKNIQRPN